MKDAAGVDTAELDALSAWTISRAPREAERAAKAAAAARALADEEHTGASIASIAALAHSDNVCIRALCGTHAVRILTSLAGFVKESRRDTQSDALLFGPPLVQTKASGHAPLSPFKWRKHGGPPAPPPAPVVRGSPRGACRSPMWR